MDRLTARNESGQAYYPKCFKEPRLGIGDCADVNCEQGYEVCEKLADYEDTEFTPEQIKEMIVNMPDAMEMCKIKIALDKLEEYQRLEERLSKRYGCNITIMEFADIFILYLEEKGGEELNELRILTNETAKQWDEYKHKEPKKSL